MSHQKPYNISQSLVDAVIALDDALERRDGALALLQADYPDERLSTERYEQHKARLDAINHSFEEKWLVALRELDDICMRIRRRQPHLNELGPEHFNSLSHLPDALAFGRVRLSYRNWRGFIPRMVPFPLSRALWLQEDSEPLLTIQQLLLRLMFCLPADRLQVIAIDPLQLGASVAPFLPLLPLKRPFTDRRVLTRAEEIEMVLQRELNHVETLLQRGFDANCPDWVSYVAAHPEAPPDYKVVAIFDAPEQLSEKSLWYLGRLLEHGPRCGVLPVVTTTKNRLADKRYAGLCESLNAHAVAMDRLWQPLFSPLHLSASEEAAEFWPGKDHLLDLESWLRQEYDNCGSLQRSLAELYDPATEWQGDSTGGLRVPVGYGEEREVAFLSFGGVDTPHHALLGGRSGSGKSNLLHVLIHSFCHHYSPQEVNLYLLDYKEGVEFNAYANPPLPQAALVATAGDPEYGISVLSHLVAEGERRAALFKEEGAADYASYRRSTGNTLPRILLIIDEFQVLFSESRQVAEMAEKLLVQLFRQGRGYGIHVLLATQTVKGIAALSASQLLSGMGCRIALSCSEEDSAAILGTGNVEAATLKSPPEGLLNEGNGARSANRRFLIPFAPCEVRRARQERLCELARRGGYGVLTKVFTGSHLPTLPAPERFPLIRDCRGLRLLVGEELTFENAPFFLTLEARLGHNLLIVGGDERIQVGLLHSILLSIGQLEERVEVVHLDARNRALPADSGIRSLSDVASWREEIARVTGDLSGAGRVIIIDGLDCAKPFHCAALPSFRPGKQDEPPSPAESLKRLLEEGPPNGTHVIAFADSWRRVSASCKELMGHFDLRIGFCLNEDEAGAFVSGSVARYRGMENGNRALFVDRLQNREVWLRPFVQSGRER